MNTKYEIFSDMDGVLVDFDTKFIDHSGGIHPRDYDDEHGRTAFWDLIDIQGGVDFWATIPWMPDGKTYWNYIKKYKPQLLSSPSLNEVSRIGKQKWVDNNIPGTKLNLAFSQEKKNLAKPNRILIDDRKDIIEGWIGNGGIGILHTSAKNTIEQLKQLGL